MNGTDDGEHICTGELARTPVSFNEPIGKKHNVSLLYEVSSCHPKGFKHVLDDIPPS
jgi:hypothetical protein